MINALYDIPLSERLDFTLGAGIGFDHMSLEVGPAEESDSDFAYQGIAGLSYAIGEKVDLTLTYRYLAVQSPTFKFGDGANSLTIGLDDVTKHTLTAGLRFYFGEEEVAAAPPPPYVPPTPPPPKVANFVIFFGFGKCNITAEADAVLSEAAATAKSGGMASVTVVGHTDSVGSPSANQNLSECRADAAKSNLVAKGVPAGAIAASGKGESDLTVQTGDGVKEPQNRRVTIETR